MLCIVPCLTVVHLDVNIRIQHCNIEANGSAIKQWPARTLNAEGFDADDTRRLYLELTVASTATHVWSLASVNLRWHLV